MEEKKLPFTSAMSPREYAAALGYIPVHIYLLPRLLAAVPGEKELSALTLNTVCYAAAALLLFLCLRRFSAASSTRCATTVPACCWRSRSTTACCCCATWR